MTSQVYYRKWRPGRFSELAGQEHVSKTLSHAVIQGRVAHSYLFCGPRGTGKTSTARILAKAANCLDIQDGDPCDRCGRCQAVNEGRFMDLIEMDAASNRGIDEVRNIRDKVNLMPVEGGKKVYIIDEAHMLTEHASNAFLKTLEEPPPHAIFILCTTEPHKILPTIISRCQRFDFRRLGSETIVERLNRICAEEGVGASPEALAAVAHSAGGSLRDAENMLEQLVVSYGNKLDKEQVYDLMGVGHGELAMEFVRYLLMGNPSGALGALNRAAWDGVDVRQLHRQAVELLRGALLLQYNASNSLDLPQDAVKELEELVPKVTSARILRSLKLFGEVNMKYDAASPLALELAVVEACMEEPAGSEPAPIPLSTEPSSRANPQAGKKLGGSDGPPANRTPPRTADTNEEDTHVTTVSPQSSSTKPAAKAPSNAPQPDQTEVDRPPAPVAPNPGGVEGPLQEQWGAMIRALSRYKGRRFNIGALLRDCRNPRIEDETLVLEFAHRSHLERMQEEVDDPQGQRAVEEALVKLLGRSYQLKIVQSGDAGTPNSTPVARSPLVRAALSLGARIVEEREL